MKWCCIAFENRYGAAGQRGLGVLVEADSEGRPLFLLQVRAFDLGSELDNTPTAPMTMVVETAIQFCPWCGVALRKWYRKSAELARPQLRIDRA